MNGGAGRGAARAATLALLLAGAIGAAGRASAQDLDAVLREVGESYARGYLAPLVSAVGAAQLTGLATTAAIPSGRLHVAIGARFVTVNIDRRDQTFRQVHEVILDEGAGYLPDDPLYGGRAMFVSEGPTVFGDEHAAGRLTAYVDGLPIRAEETIEGLLQTEWPFLAVPEVSLAGPAHLRASVRWLPRLKFGVVTVALAGAGLTYGLSDLLPDLPVDLAVGAFRQRITVDQALEADATSLFLTASRDLGHLTAYGGVALENSDFDIDYTYEGQDLHERIHFTMEGRQTHRLSAGLTLRGLGPQLNLEAGFGTMTTLSTGLQAVF